MAFETIDAHVLSLIQGSFPLDERPYEGIGQILDITSHEAFDAVLHMREAGLIRRIGATYDRVALGYDSVLAAAQTDDASAEDLGAYINSFPEVTHNYEREGALNLWFTVIAASSARVRAILDFIESRPDFFRKGQ